MSDQTAFIKLSINQFMRMETCAKKIIDKEALRLAGEYGPVLDKFNDVIFIVDREGHFIFVNKAVKEQSDGIPPEMFIGRHFSELVEPQYHEFAQSSLQKALNGKKAIPAFEMERQTESRKKITKEINWIIIARNNGEKFLMGVSRDITDRKLAQEALQSAHDELEMRVRERTADLQKANELLESEVKERRLAERDLSRSEKILKAKTRSLEEANIALKVLLQKRQNDKTDLEEKVVSNVKELVVPYLQKIQRTRLTERQKNHLDILQSNLEEIVSPFSQNLYAKFMNLTHSEIQIANLVKHGMTTKQIGEMLDLSTKTVEFHRDNIRRKLGIKNTKANLRSYILSLQ